MYFVLIILTIFEDHRKSFMKHQCFMSFIEHNFPCSTTILYAAKRKYLLSVIDKPFGNYYS